MIRELHDGPMQSLSGLRLRLDFCKQLALNRECAAVEDELGQLKDDLREIVADIRELMVEMRCPRLETLGLSEVVSRYVTQYAERTPIKVILDLTGLAGDELDFEQQLAVFRILQEAMRNAGQHSGASGVVVHAAREPSALKVSLEDNGQGFDLLGVTASYPRRGLGLAGMQERAKAVGGQVEIDSRPGRGTRINLVLPLRVGGEVVPGTTEAQTPESRTVKH